MNGNLTQAALLARAGARSFERGQGYPNAATGMEVGDGWATALRGPAVCEHLVALGLTVFA